MRTLNRLTPLILFLGAPVLSLEVPAEIPLKEGVLKFLVPAGSIDADNLAGVPFLLQSPGALAFAGEGSFLKGRYRNGKLRGRSSVDLGQTSFLSIDAGSVRLRPAAPLRVDFAGDRFRLPELAGTPLDLEALLPNADGPLRLQGSVESGSYRPGTGIDFEATLNLTDPFICSKDPVVMTLAGKGAAAAIVRDNRLRNLRVKSPGALDLAVEPEGTDPLHLEGDIEAGYRPSAGLDIDASLALASPWKWVRGPVRLTLVSGQSGSARVTTQVRDGFARAKLPGQEIQVELEADQGAMGLDGTVSSGEYRSGVITLEVALDLAQDFTYTRENQTARLEAGPVVLEVRTLPPKVVLKTPKVTLILVDEGDDEGDDKDEQAEVKNGGEKNDRAGPSKAGTLQGQGIRIDGRRTP